MSADPYPFRQIEAIYRPIWEKQDLYATGDDPEKPDVYILDFFPYPSGAGLSVGHARNYVPTCVSSRFHRMRGYNVLHPMGWDAFGLPAENYAVQHGIQPADSTRLFTDTYRQQMQLIACSYDWQREINSTDPDYYRWTQWLFLLLWRRGLAYRASGSQWWCPACQTILANEQVEQGTCWRCHSPVTKKKLKQWYFRITVYAERLLADLDGIDWPEHIKQMQRHWIGHSHGADVVFTVEGMDTAITTFTTRPDTLFGVSFLALAPEHPLVADVTTAENETAVAAYTTAALRQSDIDRTMTGRQQTGVFSGSYASHPLTGARIPIWVADYVLMDYGSGAVMGVPAHDERDHAFACRYDLPIVAVVVPTDADSSEETCFSGAGVIVNSGAYSGLASDAAAARITADLAAADKGGSQMVTKMRDWLISRQRYWGVPIPIVHCPDCGAMPVPADELPLRLPQMHDFAPAGDGRSPLARAAEWVHTPCPACGQPAQRETDTMDGFVCSSWYFLRFASPHETERPFSPEAVARWLPVDTYVGGAEHAVMHLLYARFFTKVLHDAGLVDFTEPFATLRNQGVLMSPLDGKRMSKSRGNVITPDEVVAEHGVDALRAYVLFIGPFDQDALWDTMGIRGVTRFLDRFWRTANTEAQSRDETDVTFERERHKLIQRVTAEMEDFRFNTAVAGLMAYLNSLIAAQSAGVQPAQWRRALETMTLLLAPICPFIAEAVWQQALGHDDSVHRQAWPEFDEAMTIDEMVTVVVQVNGKLRARLEMAADADESVVGETAVSHPNVQTHISGSPIRRVIVRPGLVNIVV